MNWDDFRRWFNKDFWRAFKNKAIPIKLPETQAEKDQFVRSVFNAIQSARYAPSIPETEIVTNKGYGVARTIPVFRLRDYCVYYFCIKELEDVLCGNRTRNTFGGWSLGGKLRRREADEIECESTEYGRYSFNPSAWMKAFGEFNSLLFSQLATGTFSHVLQFDLTNFYDCVRLDILERWIREESPHDRGWIIALLFYFLNHWNRRNTGLHPQAVGLPQDALADCSRILANFYLQKYDAFAAKACTKIGGEYFRYADDQMILLNDPRKVERLLLLLTRNLDRYGLRVNQKKVDLWTRRELEQYRCRNIQAIFSRPEDNKDKAKVRQFAKEFFKLSKEDLAKTWNHGMPMLNRILWARLDLLPKKSFDRLVGRFTETSYLLMATHDKLARVYELNKEQSNPVNLIKKLKVIGASNVHNAFHYQVRAFAKAKGLDGLARFCQRRLKTIRHLMDADVEAL